MAKIILSGQNFDIYDGDGQDLYARTGATSLEMIHNTGAEGVIFGHSEAGDSVEVVRKKLKTLLNRREKFGSDFLPKLTILVGESWGEFSKQVGKHVAEIQIHSISPMAIGIWEGIEESVKEQIAQIVGNQLMIILKDTPKEFMENIVIGYEPKWGSRGSGYDKVPPASPEIIGLCAKEMKLQLKNLFGKNIADKIPIIYGGRSTPERTEQILADENVEGLILGSACNTVQKTLDIAHAMIKSMGKKTKILHANFKAYNLLDKYEQYVKELYKLDDSFIVYLSPSHTNLRAVKSVL